MTPRAALSNAAQNNAALSNAALRRKPLLGLALLGLVVLWGAAPARAEYRAYELEVIDVVECRLAKQETCKRHRITTAMGPELYARTHGGPQRLGVQLMATWMCYGDTSFYKEICPRPTPREARFSVGDTVRVLLDKHITQGWQGQIEVAYFQPGIRANVYGVRFPDRQNVYARYFEKDLGPVGEAAGTAAGGANQPQAGTPTQPAAGAPTAAAATGGAAPAGTAAQPGSLAPQAVQPIASQVTPAVAPGQPTPGPNP